MVVCVSRQLMHAGHMTQGMGGCAKALSVHTVYRTKFHLRLHTSIIIIRLVLDVLAEGFDGPINVLLMLLKASEKVGAVCHRASCCGFLGDVWN